MFRSGVTAVAEAPVLIFHRIVRKRKTFGNDDVGSGRLYYGSLKSYIEG